MNNHPISNSFSFKNLIYRLNLIQIVSLFFLIYISESFIFFLIYKILLLESDITNFTLIKFTVFQSFNFSINSINIKSHFFEYLNFLQLFISLILNLIFTSAILLKFFTKPSFFYFKSKINLDKVNKKLIISLYNKTNFQITNCNFKVYARLPFKDKKGFNGLNNVKLTPSKSTFPFMDKHLVTRLIIDLNDPKNETDFFNKGLNKDLLSLLSEKNLQENNSTQYMRITIIVNGISDKIDSSLYEIKNYEININNKESINKSITFSPPNSIDIDMVNFSNSRGWENFED